VDNPAKMQAVFIKKKLMKSSISLCIIVIPSFVMQ